MAVPGRVNGLFLGMATTDFIATVPRLPAADEVFELEAFSVQGGGPAATASVAFARLGGSASFVGSIGTDDISAALSRDLASEGVEVDLLELHEGAHAPRSVILVEAGSGKRSILYSRGTAPEPALTPALEAAVSRADVLHLDGYHVGAAIQAAELAQSAGVPVALDGGAGERWPGLDELLPLVDWLVVARGFAERETSITDPAGAALELARHGAELVVITDGAHGAWYHSRTGSGHVPAFEVVVKDTTGAGDVFHGAFARAYLEGMVLPKAVRFAAAAAALKCEHPGGRPGIPTLERVQGLLKRA